MDLNSISIIIPTKDREKILKETLVALTLAVKNFNYEIIIINDSKTEKNILDGFSSKKTTIIDNPKSGVASARNLGAAIAKYNWLLFLDDDMIVFEENFDSYLKYVNISEKFCVNVEWVYPPQIIEEIKKIAFGRFLIKYGFTTMRGWSNYPDWPENSSIEVNSISSPNLFIKKNHFMLTGGYDEKFPFAGFEDYAFSVKLKTFNFRMFLDTTSLMYHNETDRTESKGWFARKVRGGETKRVAVTQGFDEMKVEQNFFKKIFYFHSPIIEPLLKTILIFTSRFQLIDAVSFKCYKMILGISLNKGYNMKR